MESCEFKSTLELYKRVHPALSCKKNELSRKKYTYIMEEDIWNYLINYVWKNNKGLTLLKMVNDILNLNEKKIKNYVLFNLSKEKRIIEDDGNDLL